MLQFIRSLLEQENIHTFATLKLEDCRILRPYLLERARIGTGTAVILAVPYATSAVDHNVSAYAVSRDYHVYFRELFDRLLPQLRQSYPDNRFVGFADHSPIDEIHAAARAGLGVIGDNGMLLTERYSSFVFIGEIITDAVLPSQAHEIGRCHHCGACRRACPVTLNKGECLSALTQKKGELTEQEQAQLAEHPLVWGCDICQEVCPYTAAAKTNGTLYDAPPFFREKTLPRLTLDILDAMSEEEFRERAYAWRGRTVIQRNLQIKKA